MAREVFHAEPLRDTMTVHVGRKLAENLAAQIAHGP